MSDDRWERVADLYQAAQDQTPEERLPLVRQRAAGDFDLRREVESLLAEDDHSLPIDEHVAATARSLLADNAAVQPGSLIGPTGSIPCWGSAGWVRSIARTIRN